MIPSNSRNSRLPIWVVIGLTIIFISSVEAKLEFVSVIFRHGDRAPDNTKHETYPNDPYLHYDFYPMGRGQLTNQGKKREFTLGEVLRNRYDSFLGKVYTPESVSALSSDYDRTKMSLQLVLAGLFPPDRVQKWSNQLNWQPIPAKYLRRAEDNIFLPDECPVFTVEYNRVIDSPEGKKRLSNFSNLMAELTTLTGKKISKPLDMFYLYHTLMAEHSLGLVLPDWAYKIFPYGELWDATVLAYELANSNPLLRRLYGGPYLRLVVNDMLALTNGTLNNRRKMYLYSGHETNIASVLHALNVYFPHVPEYSSAVILELHQIKGTYYVKILYYKGIPTEVVELHMPGCEKECTLDKFLQLTADVMPSDEDLFCDKTLTQDYANYRSPATEDSMTYNLIRTAKAIRDQ